MKLDNEFTVGVPVSQAWEVLTDLELIAPCMPGAALTGVTDGVYTGKVKIKVGPVTAEYSGTAQFSEKDDVNYRAVIDARGRDARGNGNANATISANLRAEGDRTVVNVTTDLAIAGRIAQFGSGMIKEVSARLLGQFVTCLEGRLGGDLPAAAENSAVRAVAASPAPASPAAAGTGSGSTATVSATPVSDATTVSAGPTVPADAAVSAGTAVSAAAGATGVGATAARTIAAGPEPAALNLMSVAGSAVYKRLIPLVIGLVVVAVIIYLIVR
jgi:uncharacterized protein